MEDPIKCDYCKEKITGLKDSFYCPPSYALRNFCRTTKQKNCHRAYSESREILDSYFEKVKETLKEIKIEVSLDQFAFDFKYEIDALNLKASKISLTEKPYYGGPYAPLASLKEKILEEVSKVIDEIVPHT